MGKCFISSKTEATFYCDSNPSLLWRKKKTTNFYLLKQYKGFEQPEKTRVIVTDASASQVQYGPGPRHTSR